MANKRQKKKNQKKALMKQAQSMGIKSKGLTQKQLNTSVSHEQEKRKKAAQKQHKAELQKARRQRDKERLLAAGIPEHLIKAKDYESSKATERRLELWRLENKQVSPVDSIDWFRMRHSKKAFYIAYRDLTGELTFQKIYGLTKNMTPRECCEALWEIAHMKKTFDRKKYQKSRRSGSHVEGGSSGAAGLSEYQYASPDKIRHKKKKGWQTIKKVGWQDFRLIDMFRVMVALLSNICEEDRESTYLHWAEDILEVEPLLEKVLYLK